MRTLDAARLEVWQPEMVMNLFLKMFNRFSGKVGDMEPILLLSKERNNQLYN